MTEITYKNFSENISKNPNPVFWMFYNHENDEERHYLNTIMSMCLNEDTYYQSDIKNEGAIFASLYGILSTPTLLILHAGKETARYSGFLTKEQFLGIYQV